MNKFRSTLVTLALLLSLSAPSFLLGPLSNIASGLQVRSVHSSYVTSKAARPVAIKRYGPCPAGGAWDC
ncbi:MAG TPA: hypothetical protein VFA41_18540 [Ktedonobacteraceae bacterium]|nr:hypothetical protein [Ktedonobacteraceae bacterium]